MPIRWTFWFFLVLNGTSADGFLPPARAADAAKPTAEADSSPLSGLIETVIRDQLKTDYVDDDHWGQTRRATVGYKVTGKPFEWDLKSRKKEVNDGLWEKYHVRLVDPDEHLHINITRLEMTPTGRIAFELTLSAKLAADARVERWRMGVKMLNASADAEAVVEIRLAGDVGIKLVTGEILPGVAIEPKIADVKLKLLKFDLKRLSKIEGRTAHELGDSLKDTIQKELHRREPKIVAKLNKSIAKRQDKLQLSPEEFVRSGWSKLQQPAGKSE
jgi:hypothetical protein